MTLFSWTYKVTALTFSPLGPDGPGGPRGPVRPWEGKRKKYIYRDVSNSGSSTCENRLSSAAARIKQTNRESLTLPPSLPGAPSGPFSPMSPYDNWRVGEGQNNQMTVHWSRCSRWENHLSTLTLSPLGPGMPAPPLSPGIPCRPGGPWAPAPPAGPMAPCLQSRSIKAQHNRGG